MADWMQRVAEELTNQCDLPSTSGLRLGSRVSVWVLEVIKRHCPMKEGEAWMKVPRCETCAHWKFASGEIGWCGVERTKIDAQPGANLVTTKNFGCVQWKEK